MIKQSKTYRKHGNKTAKFFVEAAFEAVGFKCVQVYFLKNYILNLALTMDSVLAKDL